MTYTFTLPCRPICHDPTNFHFDNEQVNITADQESEYDADVEAADVEDEKSQCEANRLILSPTQASTSPLIAWQAFNTTHSVTPGVEIAEVDVTSQVSIIEGSHWHAVRTLQIKPLQATGPRFSYSTDINVPPTSCLHINIAEMETLKVEDTQSRIVESNGWSIFRGSQTGTSQANSIEPDKPSFSYTQTSNKLQLRHKNTAKASMNAEVYMPQLKAKFRRYKKEYISASAIEQVKWFRYRITCLGTGNKDENDYETTAVESEWASFWERRRWLKREMLRIKDLYTLTRRRRRERIQYVLRAGYDIAFIKSFEEN